VARQAVCGPAIAASRSLSLGLEGAICTSQSAALGGSSASAETRAMKCSVAAAPRTTGALHGSADPF
jgi:hypothetical protein